MRYYADHKDMGGSSPVKKSKELKRCKLKRVSLPFEVLRKRGDILTTDYANLDSEYRVVGVNIHNVKTVEKSAQGLPGGIRVESLRIVTTKGEEFELNLFMAK